jgi:hypothetical protein
MADVVPCFFNRQKGLHSAFKLTTAMGTTGVILMILSFAAVAGLTYLGIRRTLASDTGADKGRKRKHSGRR